MANLIEILQDSYSKFSPYEIRKHPPGRRLHWKSKIQLQRGGWQGWIPVQKGDGIFEEVEKYITETPLKYVQTVDTTLQRGQNILCWKPLGAWLVAKMDAAKRGNSVKARHQAEIASMPGKAWGQGPETFSDKKNPLELDVQLQMRGIDKKELELPEADPRNYVPYMDAAPIEAEVAPPKVVLAPDTPVVQKRKRGRPPTKNKK